MSQGSRQARRVFRLFKTFSGRVPNASKSTLATRHPSSDPLLPRILLTPPAKTPPKRLIRHTTPCVIAHTHSTPTGLRRILEKTEAAQKLSLGEALLKDWQHAKTEEAKTRVQLDHWFYNGPSKETFQDFLKRGLKTFGLINQSAPEEKSMRLQKTLSRMHQVYRTGNIPLSEALRLRTVLALLYLDIKKEPWPAALKKPVFSSLFALRHALALQCRLENMLFLLAHSTAHAICPEKKVVNQLAWEFLCFVRKHSDTPTQTAPALLQTFLRNSTHPHVQNTLSAELRDPMLAKMLCILTLTKDLTEAPKPWSGTGQHTVERMKAMPSLQTS